MKTMTCSNIRRQQQAKSLLEMDWSAGPPIGHLPGRGGLQLQLQAHIYARWNERTPDRCGYRNGYYNRSLYTSRRSPIVKTVLVASRVRPGIGMRFQVCR